MILKFVFALYFCVDFIRIQNQHSNVYIFMQKLVNIIQTKNYFVEETI